MSQSAAAIDEPAGALVADLLPTCERALLAAERFVAEARGAVAALVMGEKGADPALLEQPMLQDALDEADVPWTAFRYAENLGQFQVIREQAGTFADSIKLWSDA